MGASQSKVSTSRKKISHFKLLGRPHKFRLEPCSEKEGVVAIKAIETGTTASEASSSEDNLSVELDVSVMTKWEQKLLSDPKNRLALSALNAHPFNTILTSPSVVLTDPHIFSDKVELEGSPVANQKSSGRCWIFAATNVFRVAIMKKYKLSNFQFSQNYLFFWDKLEKANYFLEQIIDTVDEPLDGRLVQWLLTSPVGDGGQWDMIVNLVEKYGLIPETLYPDTSASTASTKVNWLITSKLREAAIVLRHIASSSTPKAYSAVLQKYKSQTMQEVHSILVLTLGKPPKPDQQFKWEFLDKESKFHSVTYTPTSFYQEEIQKQYTPAFHFSLVNDPRNPYLRCLMVERLGNVVGGRPVKYVNVPMNTMKQAIINMIKADRLVFFGCDVGKFSDTTKGILDTKLFDYELGFGIKLSMNKAERLSAHESLMTHAMVITGVHIVDDKPVRWRVENSWGDKSGEKGYLVMTDEWMDEYCYQAVIDAKFLDKEVSDVINAPEEEVLRLPVWDPMGSLA